MNQWASVLAAVVAPTTAVTALLFYFGWMHAYWFFHYFGVHSTVLGLGTVDFVMRAADALFVPAAVFGCAVPVLLVGHTVLRARLAAGARPAVVRAVLLALAVVGLVSALAGLLTVFIPTPLDRQVALAPLCLGGGVLLLFYVVRLRRVLEPVDAGRGQVPTASLEWIGVLTLVALSLFWAATDYSAAVGREQARRYAADLDREPDVVIYSAGSLRLAAPGIRELRCEDREGTYRFRYDGLKLVLQSGGQYVFLPERWSPETGTALVIPRTDALRLEFLPSSATLLPSTC